MSVRSILSTFSSSSFVWSFSSFSFSLLSRVARSNISRVRVPTLRVPISPSTVFMRPLSDSTFMYIPLMPNAFSKKSLRSVSARFTRERRRLQTKSDSAPMQAPPAPMIRARGSVVLGTSARRTRFR